MSAPGTPEERFEAALAVTNPHGWGNLSQQDGYADRFRRLKDLVSRDPELVRLSGGARNYTLLHHAAWGNGTEVAEFLLANGAVADARANGGATPLAVACTYGWGRSETAALLAERSWTPDNLRIATALGRLERMAEFFDENGVTAQAGRDREPWAASYEFPDSPLPTDAAGVLGEAMDFAARSGQLAGAQFLLDRGAEVNRWTYNAPPIFWAALYGQEEMVDWLIAQGARVDGKDTTYDASLGDWARFFEHRELADRLDGMLGR